ncbi:Coiled-coil domain-containing protein 94 [Orchesella cincta]|uniref:Splicing factor YJU2 n=1 Tax=Orchesella cincta TaxID=48709 RepID=A0A1D2MXW9_ORCCI|nr:Coiled-coil domain-containing protein 94 [Orchesella cincta]
MSERKVLNKYYPPDFDPSKIPRARQSKNRQFTVRLMAPCNMRCTTCGEYIYKGKKFNARKEDVDNDTYLGIRIYRFYIKCTRCLAEISFKTDPESTDYVIEAGATRNFMALKLAEEQAVREEQAEKEEDATNPMKMLEKRTQASRHEMAVLEALEELKDLNQRQITPDYDVMLDKYEKLRQVDAVKQEEEDNAFVDSIFGKNGDMVVKRLEDNSDDSEEDAPPKKKFAVVAKPTDMLTETPLLGQKEKEKEASIGFLSANKKKLVLVKPKAIPVAATTTSANSNNSSSTVTKPASASASNSSSGSAPTPQTAPKSKENSVGLGLLGAYGSDSGSDSN